MKKFVIPFEQDFIDYLVNVLDFTPESAKAYCSRLRRVLDEFAKQQKIPDFDALLMSLCEYDVPNALKVLDAVSVWSISYKDKSKKNIPDEPLDDCRTAVERYKEFLYFKNQRCILDADNAYEILETLCKKYSYKIYSKLEMKNKIKNRRTTEDRLTGDVYYPIRLIRKIFNGDTFISDYFDKMIENIRIRIDSNGGYVTVNDLADDNAMEITSKGVSITLKDGSMKNVYTSSPSGKIKPLKVSTKEDIHADHDTPISKELTRDKYPSLARLTDMMKTHQAKSSTKVKWDKETMDVFIKENEAEINNLKSGLKEDLQKLLEDMVLILMSGSANLKKGNRY